MATTNYLWDRVEHNVIGEFDDTGATIASYVTKPTLYGDVMSQRRVDSGPSYFQSDALGTITELTNSSGTATDTYRSNAFGDMVESTGTTICPGKYVGRRGYYGSVTDSAICVRERFYQPAIARWMSTDPLVRHSRNEIEIVSDAFRYVKNAPTQFVDPSGLFGEGWTRQECLEKLVELLDRAEEILDDCKDAAFSVEDTMDCIDDFNEENAHILRGVRECIRRMRPEPRDRFPPFSLNRDCIRVMPGPRKKPLPPGLVSDPITEPEPRELEPPFGTLPAPLLSLPKLIESLSRPPVWSPASPIIPFLFPNIWDDDLKDPLSGMPLA